MWLDKNSFLRSFKLQINQHKIFVQESSFVEISIYVDWLKCFPSLISFESPNEKLIYAKRMFNIVTWTESKYKSFSPLDIYCRSRVFPTIVN